MSCSLLRMIDESQIRKRYQRVRPVLDERGRRHFAAAEAMVAGRGGVSAVARATGIVRSTIQRGKHEISNRTPLAPGRVRQPGAGGQERTKTDPTLLDDLTALVEPETRGDPESPLRWTTKSLRNLARTLTEMGHKVGRTLVRKLLREQGYSLQANCKTREGADHPDRDAQFRHINEVVKAALAAGIPVISVDTKKKELVGNFKNSGREWRPKGEPEEVSVHDFMIKEKGRATPYGVYDVGANIGWVSVGLSADTASFAVNAIRSWWMQIGRHHYPRARRLLVSADGGGSNGYRVRLWKYELQQLSDELGIEISVCHLPPGTSKWNKVEHRLFSFISKNWRGKPLVSYQTIVSLISATTTEQGLKVRCKVDHYNYERGVKVSDEELAALNLTCHEFHGEWNYTIRPRGRRCRGRRFRPKAKSP